MNEPTPTDERTVVYAIAAVGRRRFLTALAEICDAHGVTWEWDLVVIVGARKVEAVLRGEADHLDAVEREIAAWRDVERSDWTSGGSGTADC